MTKDDCFYIGRVAKTHGIKGEVTIKLDVDDPSAYLDMKYFLLEINKVLTPFFVERLTMSGDKFFVGIQDVNTVEAASALTGKSVFLPLEMLPKLTGKQFYYHEVKGFTVVDENKGELGPIKEILEYPTQAIIQVFKDGKEILIPILDQVIVKVDRKGKKLHVKAPEGLIDMYLGS
jgi:16S rRNA processing protein RimM